MSGPVNLVEIAAQMEGAAEHLADATLPTLHGVEEFAASAILNEVWKGFETKVWALAREHGLHLDDVEALLAISFRAYGRRIDHRINGGAA